VVVGMDVTVGVAVGMGVGVDVGVGAPHAINSSVTNIKPIVCGNTLLQSISLSLYDHLVWMVQARHLLSTQSLSPGPGALHSRHSDIH
jgi:hypothetical protein